jgi:hypothetical protein
MRRLALALLMASALPALAQDTPTLAAPTETVQVEAAPLSDDAIRSFVSTYAAPSLMIGKIARWTKPICVRTQGLPKELNEVVANRIRTVIREVGAPLDKDNCALNAGIYFDGRPQLVLDDIALRAPELLGYHEVAQARSVATMRHPIQAWYATETRDNNGARIADTPGTTPLCDSVQSSDIWQSGGSGLSSGTLRVDTAKYNNVLQEMQKFCGKRAVTGNRVNDGLSSEFTAVTIVASMDTVNYHELAAVADYIALLMLSQTSAFAACQQMDSIANLLVPGCDVGNRIKGLTQGDIAYLKALYRAKADGLLVMQQASIATEMKKALAER